MEVRRARASRWSSLMISCGSHARLSSFQGRVYLFYPSDFPYTPMDVERTRDCETCAPDGNASARRAGASPLSRRTKDGVRILKSRRHSSQENSRELPQFHPRHGGVRARKWRRKMSRIASRREPRTGNTVQTFKFPLEHPPAISFDDAAHDYNVTDGTGRGSLTGYL